MSEFDDILQQIKQNNQEREQLKHAVKSANFDSIGEVIWKVAAKLLGEHISILKKRPFLRLIIEELVPIVYHFIRENWTLFFPY
jgi:hypothetical protein